MFNKSIKYLPYIFLSLSILIVTVVGVWPAKIDLSKNISAQYLIIGSPWASDNREIIDIAVNASGNPIDQGLFSFMLIVASDNPDFISRAYDNGAFLVLNPFIKGGCIRRSPNHFVKV